ncbi:hypothetical protein H6CHR_01851 [Variovorax sp. PBL-H6]|uniref:hypothetical protein n=1 Tax=Variovorax sp. PBL-H6 TaxID=434009 RepID=UPI0013161ED0|nr:hypothetical protein [Variovorax sp. PBL-H6]VTU22757.1 hypothetical protein H6CHR_01851 [Variovorax sp. PBL-H6]
MKTEAQLRYEAYLNGTEPVVDSMRKAARSYVLLAVALGKVLSSQTLRVKAVADDMTRDHDYMSTLNEVVQLAGPAAAGTGNQYVVFTGSTEKEREDFRAAFLLAAKMDGTPPNYSNYSNTAPGKYEWRMTVEECGTALKNLQFDVDDLNSLSQQEQMALNTLMTNLNNCVEAATAGTQKAGTQAQSANRSFA